MSRLLNLRPFHFLGFLAFLMFPFVLLAQDGRGNAVRLHNGVFQPSGNVKKWIDGVGNVPEQQFHQVLIQFRELPNEALKRSLEKGGIVLEDFVGNSAFTAIIYPDFNKIALSSSDLLSIDNVMPQWKIIGVLDAAQNGILPLTVLISRSATKSVLASSLQSLKGKITSEKFAAQGVYEIEIPSTNLISLAAFWAIKSVETSKQDHILNRESQATTKVNVAHRSLANGGFGLMGDGMVVGVGDNASGIHHADLRDRIVDFVPTAYTNHGMHINGIVGGAGNLDIRNEGFAPHALLLDHLYSNVLAQTPVMVADYGMTVTNNSYGNDANGDCNAHGTYNATSFAIDQLSLDHPEVMHVFAGGNSGKVTCSPFATGFGTVFGSYQSAKNGIVVANMDKRFIIAEDNARGPVKDGRLKPEISAVGSAVSSTRGTDIYLTSGGTSMASPMVAGASALLGQRYRQLYGGANASSVLIKSLLLNGSMDVGNPGPDYTYGFGALNLYRSLQILENGGWKQDSIANNQQKTFTINVPANTAVLKVMLAWSDLPASPIAAKSLVNDLDLELNTPSNALHLPLILNATPANVNDNATEGVDRLNNVEQIVLNYPAAGVYTVRVKGSTITSTSQHYVAAYDFVPDEIKVHFPGKNDVVQTVDTLRINWDASTKNDPFTIELSTDNGSSWRTLSNNEPADRKYYSWKVPDSITSPECKVRVSRTGQSFTTESFVINKRPIVSFSSVQCPGSIHLLWTKVPGVSGYMVMRKIGAYMQDVALVTDTSYAFRNLAYDSLYYVCVKPMFGAIAGFRSYGISRYPNNGNCQGSFTDNDIAVEALLSPLTGRANTSTALGTAVQPIVRIRNLDNQQVGSYQLSYSVNGGNWVSQTFSNLPANTALNQVMSNTVSLSTVGTYVFRIAIKNLSGIDPNTGNDSMTVRVRNLKNEPLQLTIPFGDDFDDLPKLTLVKDSLGFTPNQHWDFENETDTGRLRSWVGSDVSIAGKGISMDAFMNRQLLQNYLIGTFNLSNYNVAIDELRCEFDYKIHGTPKTALGNLLRLRGQDTDTWQDLFLYNLNSTAGLLQHSGSISITDVIVAAGQSVTTSSQLQFGQQDTSLIASNAYGNGFTMDNFKLYTVQNDVGLVNVVSPVGAPCNLGNAVPLTVMVYNGVRQNQNNIAIFYQLDTNAVVSEMIPSIVGKDSIVYTFTQLMNAAQPGLHKLQIWVKATGDSYTGNDSILNYTFRNEPLISSFPYLENFEENDGHWYSNNIAKGWAWGNPKSGKVNDAASGKNAWKTNLNGVYPDASTLYLNSPCFNLDALNKPLLSFSIVTDIENCGTSLCDGAWMEYSTNDGASWNKLGRGNDGYNWYNDTTNQVWAEQDRGSWKVASIPLPPFATGTVVRFRFVLESDPGAGFEGLGIDDIHITEMEDIVPGSTLISQLTKPVSGVNIVKFAFGNGTIAEIIPLGNDLGNVEVTAYDHEQLIDSNTQRYFFPRSFTFKSEKPSSDSLIIRMYVTDSMLSKMVLDTTCPTCSKVDEVYRLGANKYNDPDKSKENGSRTDNLRGIYSFYPYSKLAWVPLNKGYYAEVKVPSLSEFWFFDDGPTFSYPPANGAVNLDAKRINETDVLLNWHSKVDSLTIAYELQRRINNEDYGTINSQLSRQLTPSNYVFTDKPTMQVGDTLYYRVKWTFVDGSVFFTAEQSLFWDQSNVIVSVYPNPVLDKKFFVNWRANPDEKLQLTLTDMHGRLTYQQTITAQNFENTTSIQVPQNASGIYFLKTLLKGELQVWKLVW